MTETLTLQVFKDCHWQDAAYLRLPYPKKGRSGPAQLEYEPSYALRELGDKGLGACAINYPVELVEVYRHSRWFSFLDDWIPSGASRRYWIRRLGLEAQGAFEQDFTLLRLGTVAPIGNWRIKEAVESLPTESEVQHRRFTVADVANRDTDFLEYAQDMGAISGGAAGAGGEAPKLLVRMSESGHVWIDAHQQDGQNLDRHYLVKFPRGRRLTDDQDILRAEYYYYQELAMLGIPTIDANAMRLVEGARYPSLWLPRFDVEQRDGFLERFGFESVYSVMEAQPGETLNQFEVINKLVSRLADVDGFRREAFVFDYLRRDFLNVVFGNSDNHGRNTAILKTPEGIGLSPVFDFAPMKADPEGVVRTLKWGEGYELGGEFHWHKIAQALSDHADADWLIMQLEELSGRLVGLRARLCERGMPASLIDRPAIGLDRVEQRLSQWGLLA